MLTSKVTVGVGVGHVQTSSASAARPLPEVLPEDVLADVAAQLSALRDDAADLDTVESNFRVRVLGVSGASLSTKLPKTSDLTQRAKM